MTLPIAPPGWAPDPDLDGTFGEDKMLAGAPPFLSAVED